MEMLNSCWLIPEEKCPCDIFLYFRGQYALGLTKDSQINFEFLDKISRAQLHIIYIKKEELPAWNAWLALRHPKNETFQQKTQEQIGLYGNKRAELISYVQKTLIARDAKNNENAAFLSQAAQLLSAVSQSPMLDWYFQQFHEPPDLFRHCGRVAYSIAVFVLQQKVLTQKSLENLLFSTLIHELQGSLDDSMNRVVSVETLALLEKKQHPVPEEVLAILKEHDELFSGKGFPKNKVGKKISKEARIFSLFHHFDLLRATATGTRRSRFDNAKKTLTARQQDFDPEVWSAFWPYWENDFEAVS